MRKASSGVSCVLVMEGVALGTHCPRNGEATATLAPPCPFQDVPLCDSAKKLHI